MACEKSLRALQTDCIDLCLAHRINAVTPIEPTIAAVARLKAAGKIRHLGLSEVSAANAAAGARRASDRGGGGWVFDVQPGY
jgi:aryl-alcohol dehydrogenase-like predicted oxidoreductase